MCLTCRKYIAPSDPQWACDCEFSCPSLDGKTLATAEQIARELNHKDSP